MDNYQRYLKYKNKYFNLKNQLGGASEQSLTDETLYLVNVLKRYVELIFNKNQKQTVLSDKELMIVIHNKNKIGESFNRMNIQFEPLMLLAGNRPVNVNLLEILQINEESQLKHLIRRLKEYVIENKIEQLLELPIEVIDFKNYNLVRSDELLDDKEKIITIDETPEEYKEYINKTISKFINYIKMNDIRARHYVLSELLPELGLALIHKNNKVYLCEQNLGWNNNLITQYELNEGNKNFIYFSSRYYVESLKDDIIYGTRADGRLGGTIKGLINKITELKVKIPVNSFNFFNDYIGNLSIFNEILQIALNNVNWDEGIILQNIQPTDDIRSKGDYRFTDITPEYLTNNKIILQSKVIRQEDGSYRNTGYNFIIVGFNNLSSIILSILNKIRMNISAYGINLSTFEGLLIASFMESLVGESKLLQLEKLLNAGRPIKDDQLKLYIENDIEMINNVKDLAALLSERSKIINYGIWMNFKENLGISKDKLLCLRVY